MPYHTIMTFMIKTESHTEVKIETELHSGHCGHCKTKVPLDASVCAGCGAYWGFENGTRTRQKLYDDSVEELGMFKKVLLFILAICFVPPLFDKSGWGVLALMMIIIAFTFGAPVFALIKMYLEPKRNKELAKDISNGAVDWWVSNKM